MALTANLRGWGTPPTSRTKIKTITLSNGIKLPVHTAIADLVKALCEETMKRGYKLRAGEVWGYAPRKIRGLENSDKIGAWSNHSYGLAVDLNSLTNPMTSTGKVKTDMPKWVPDLWKKYGFRWGGDYPGKRKDAMHFEFMGTLDDAAKLTKKYKDDHMVKKAAPARKQLERGDRGEPVRELQRKLNAHGAHLVVDGVFGEITEGVVRWFQKNHKLKVDGIVGPKTWAALA